MNNQNNKGFIRNPFLIILLLATIITGYQFFTAGSQVATKEITYSELVTALEDENVKSITYQPNNSIIEIKGEYKKEQEAKNDIASAIKLFQVSSTTKYKQFSTITLASFDAF